MVVKRARAASLVVRKFWKRLTHCFGAEEAEVYEFSMQILFRDHFGAMSKRQKLARDGIATAPSEDPNWELVDQKLALGINHMGQNKGATLVHALWRRKAHK